MILPGTLATHGLPNPPTPTRNPLRLTPPAVKKALFKARPRFARRFMKVIKRERPEAFQEYVERRGGAMGGGGDVVGSLIYLFRERL